MPIPKIRAITGAGQGDPHNTFYKFQLEGLTSEIEKAIESAGTDDIHKLAAQCYKTLSEYYQFYKTQLGVEESTAKRCKEELESLPFTSDHLWKHKKNSLLPVNGCVNCGISSDEWIETFEQRLGELGQVGVAVFRQEGDLVTLDVKP